MSRYIIRITCTDSAGRFSCFRTCVTAESRQAAEAEARRQFNEEGEGLSFSAINTEELA